MRRIYHLTRSLISLILVLLMTQSIVQSQTTASADILRASYDEQNNLVIQVDLERGISVTSASLISSGILYTLTVEPQSLPTELWFILDAGGSMVNAYTTIADEVRRLIQGKDDNQAIGGIIFSDDLHVLNPTTRVSQLESWLDGYTANPNTRGCIVDALNELSEIDYSARVVRRMIVLAGDSQSNSACIGTIASVDAPVDMIIIGNQTSTIYQDIARQTGGTLSQTAILGLQARLGEVQNSWEGSVMAVSMPVTQRLEAFEVRLTLSNGEVISEQILIEGDFGNIAPTTVATEISVTATSASSQTATPTQEPTAQIASVDPTPISPSNTASNAPLISNSALIFGGGVASAIVVVIVVMFLLGFRLPSKAANDNETVYDTELFSYDDEAEFDQTEIVTMREIMSHTGDTLVAKLTDERSRDIHEIHRPVSTLGRKANSDILIVGHTQISREHVRFTTRDDGSIWLTRLTQNPILVNEHLVQTTRELENGDILQLSPSLRLKYEVVEQQEDKTE